MTASCGRSANGPAEDSQLWCRSSWRSPIWASSRPPPLRPSARVIANFVGNAIKFTPASGRIRVSVRVSNTGVRVSVSDTGPGIPPEFHERIFEKFGQVEAARHGAKHSSGLGLTFCKFAVEAHGGTIGVDSVVGQGSTFWFVVPQQGPAPTAAAPAPAGS